MKNSPRAVDFIDLTLVTNFPDEERGIIVLDPELSLGTVKKYLFDFVEHTGQSKAMPLYFKVKPDV